MNRLLTTSFALAVAAGMAYTAFATDDNKVLVGKIQRVVFLDGFIVGIHLIYLFKGWRGAVPGGRVGGFDAAALIGADDAAQQRGALLRPQRAIPTAHPPCSACSAVLW